MIETWAQLPGFSKYEVSADGFGPDQRPVRSVDRTVGARRIKGVLLSVKVGTHGYLEVKIYDDSGKQQTRTVHSLVMLAYAGPCPAGQEVRHFDDSPFNNRWRPGPEVEAVAAGGNLFYGTKAQQQTDKYRNGRPRPAVRHCVRCGGEFTGNARRCHECVVAIGIEAARLMRAGKSAPAAAAALDYPSVEGIVSLAVTHGGYGRSFTQRVLVTLRGLRAKVTQR